MMKQRKLHFPFLSAVLCILLLFACFSFGIITSAETGATYVSDEAAIADGYSFCVEGKYYKTLAACYTAVPQDGTVRMIKDYTENKACEEVGKGGTSVKTYTIQGGGFTYRTNVNHGLHFQNSNVTVDGMNYSMTGTGAGPRVDETTSLTLKNATWEKTRESGGWWQPAVIVYGSLILDEGAVIKSNNGQSTKDSHAVYTEKKTGTPTVIVKGNAVIEAKKGCCFFERHAANIRIESERVTLTAAEGSIRGGEEKADSFVTIAGQTSTNMADAELRSKWQTLYRQMEQTWFENPIASVNGESYYNLCAALLAADGGTVTLLDDLTLTAKYGFQSERAINVTLDGGGKTVSGGNFSLLSLGGNVTCTMKNITLRNGNGGKTGTLDLRGATVTLGTGAKITNAGTDRVNLGNSEWVGISATGNGSRLNIGEGAVVEVCGTAIKSDGVTSETVINGGTIKTGNRGYVTNNSSSTLTVNGGVFETSRPTDSLIMTYDKSTDARITINGGTLKTAGIPLFSGSAKTQVTGGTFTVGSESYTVNRMTGYSLTLGDEIGINFYAAITDETANVAFTLPGGGGQTVALADATKTVKFGLLPVYSFSCGVSAAEMTANVTAVLTAGTATDSATVSAVTYAKAILADENRTENDKAMVTAMLHYGAAAQTAFGRNTENLANAGMEAQDASGVTADAGWRAVLSGEEAGITYYGTSLLLKSKTTIRHWFRLEAGKRASDFTFRLGDEALTAATYNDSFCYVDVTGISASMLSTASTVTVGGLSVGYSAMSYAYEVLTAENPDAELLAIVRALVLYSRAANAYFTK